MFDRLTPDLVLAFRRWSRIRRIRSALRSIRRTHTQIKFTTVRKDQIITVQFDNESLLTQFALVWPAQAPSWRVVSTTKES